MSCSFSHHRFNVLWKSLSKVNCASSTQIKIPPPSCQKVPHRLPAAVGPQHSVWLWGWWTGRTAAPRSPPHPSASTYRAAPEPVWPPGEDPSLHTWGTLWEPAEKGRRIRKWTVLICAALNMLKTVGMPSLPSPAQWGSAWTSTPGPVLQRSAAWSVGSSQLSVGVEKLIKFSNAWWFFFSYWKTILEKN